MVSLAVYINAIQTSSPYAFMSTCGNVVHMHNHSVLFQSHNGFIVSCT